MLWDNEHQLHSSLSKKNELERALQFGLHGTPEIKSAEKKKFLGVFREQVMAVITQQQVKEPIIYTEVIRALKDVRSARLIINGSLEREVTRKYRDLAEKMAKPYKVVYDPDTPRESAALVVASDQAINLATIDAENRQEKLLRLGLPAPLIQSAGKKVCQECVKRIRAADPEELINYKTLAWTDAIMGEHCPAHSED